MEIIITDLTRFKDPNIVCIVGINPTTNECIRPLPYLLIDECRRLNILPGAILHGNFQTRPVVAPHIEDRNYQGQLSFKGPCTAESFMSILKATESLDAEDGFSVSLPIRQKYIPTITPPDKSIITLSVNPSKLSIVPDSYKPGKIRVTFSDKSGHTFQYLSITDLGFFNYAERHSQEDNFSKLNNFIHSQDEVYVRLGLSREFTSPDRRTGFWLQVNGIYTFPNYLEEIRCCA